MTSAGWWCAPDQCRQVVVQEVHHCPSTCAAWLLPGAARRSSPWRGRGRWRQTSTACRAWPRRHSRHEWRDPHVPGGRPGRRSARPWALDIVVVQGESSFERPIGDPSLALQQLAHLGEQLVKDHRVPLTDRASASLPPQTTGQPVSRLDAAGASTGGTAKKVSKMASLTWLSRACKAFRKACKPPARMSWIWA